MVHFSAMGASRQHGIVVGALYYVGFFLLFCSLGTFGSAGFLTYHARNWVVTNAELQNCSLGTYPLHKEPKKWALNCGITYHIAGHVYKNLLHTRLTSSIQERDAITKWIASNRGTVVARANPSHPDEYVIESSLPGTQGRKAGDFANAAIVLGSISLVLLAAAHSLARRGW